MFFLFSFVSFQEQAEQLQFTAASTCTDGEIPEVQFGRLNTFHNLTDGLQHLQNFLKKGGWSSGRVYDAHVPIQVFTCTKRDSQPVLLTS